MHPCSRQNGFAVVIALSLMAFITLLLISITTFIRVETVNAAQSRTLTQARQNALLGLQEALGQLQAAAGPDQRVTATGSLSANAGTGTEHLVGVWNSEDRNGDGKPDGSFEGWLVSRADPTEVANVAFIDGNNMPINTVENTDGTVAYTSTADDHVILVGAGSTQQDPNNPDSMQGVVAQKKDLLDADADVSGCYAWWIGDEGVKATINIVDPASASASSTENKIAAAMSMPRLAGEAMTGFGIRANDPDLAKIHSLKQVNLLTPDPQSSDPLTSDGVKRRFHDMTLWSHGVQSDTRNGGLKKDLSLLFELSDTDWRNSKFYKESPTEYKEAPVVGDVSLLFSPRNNDLIDGLTISIPYGDQQLYGPTWDKLRNYYRLYKSVNNRTTGPKITASPGYPATSDMGYGSHRKNWAHSSSRIGWRTFLGSNDPAMSRNASGNENYYGETSNMSFTRNTTAAVAPYLVRITMQVSVEIDKDATADPPVYRGTWILFPVVYLHNPYNISVELPESRLLWSMRDHVIAYTINGGSVTTQNVSNSVAPVDHLWNDAGSGEAEFLIPPTTFAPGEILAFAPSTRSGWANSISMIPYNSLFSLGPGGDGLFLGPYTIKDATADSDILRTTYSTDAFLKFAFEMKNSNVEWDTLTAIITNNPEDLVGFNWVRDVSDLNSTKDFKIEELLSSRRAITTFDFYVKPVDIDVYDPGSSINTSRLLFPSFVSSNPLAASDSIHSAAGQGSAIVSPLRIGYASDGRTDSGVISTGTFAENGYWGGGIDYGATQATILEVPTHPLHSLGHLQHANLIDLPHYPALAVGNSFSTPFLTGNNSIVNAYKDSALNNTTDGDKLFYDLSYLANHALWDSYYFSSIAPQTNDQTFDDPSVAGNFIPIINDFVDETKDGRLHNPRMVLHRPDDEVASDTIQLLSKYETSASRLYTNGAFNINSTSVEAWKAFLAGLRNAVILKNDGINQAITDAAAFLHHTRPTGDGQIDADYAASAAWQGFTSLDDAQLTQLATKIVDEVRSRTLALGSAGNPTPFTALSMFINRMPYSNTGAHQASGLLQAAIENANINNDFSAANTFDSSDWNSSISSIKITPIGRSNDARPYSNGSFNLNTAAAAPTYLLQSDLLQLMGPYISARSDTFRIRSYGEVIDPITGFTNSSAWLEAIVQRTPEPVIPGTSPQEPQDPQFMGRKFKVLQVRWLNEDEV